MKSTPVLALVAAVTLAGCGSRSDDKAAESNAPATVETPVSPAPATPPAAAPVTFDVTKVPVSTAALGEFPYVPVPAGYAIGDTKTMDLAGFPIWSGAGFLNVEGKTYMATSRTPEGKTYSRLEFERGMETAVKAAGGVQIAKSVAPNEVIDDIPQTLRDEMSLGIGPIYGSPITSYVIRRSDRIIWIQTVSDTSHTTWTVVDAPAG
jgi:hypothetical protein